MYAGVTPNEAARPSWRNQLTSLSRGELPGDEKPAQPKRAGKALSR
jgi:hypothetical protein